MKEAVPQAVPAAKKPFIKPAPKAKKPFIIPKKKKKPFVIPVKKKKAPFVIPQKKAVEPAPKEEEIKPQQDNNVEQPKPVKKPFKGIVSKKSRNGFRK